MDRKTFSGLLGKKVLVTDGAMGTLLMSSGYNNFDLLNLENPSLVASVHKKYAEAGADIIFTNTFGANRMNLAKHKLDSKTAEINKKAVEIARGAAPNCLIAGDIGPLDDYLEPVGNLSFDEAYKIYFEQASALKEADVLVIETMSDIKMLKAAAIAARDACSLPIIVSMTFQGGRTATGTDAESYAVIMDALDIDAIGINCSEGPEAIIDVAKIILKNTSKPVSIKPNAGMPSVKKGKAVYSLNADEFSRYAKRFCKMGASMIGGCCGTTPAHIKAIAVSLKGKKPVKRKKAETAKLCSRFRAVAVKGKTIIAGERINPTGRKAFKEQLSAGRMDYARQEAARQKEEGALLLDVNTGVAGLDEISLLPKAVSAVESACDLPLIIDSSNPSAIEAALKQCSGKPIVNSVNGSYASMDTFLPLVKKYGAAFIALCLDEKGIPKTADERIAISERIISRAEKIGIAKKDIFVDCIAMAKAAGDNENAAVESVAMLKKKGYNTIMGISNISHGLPDRHLHNIDFFKKASKAGLSVGIMNPADFGKSRKRKANAEKAEKADYTAMNAMEKLRYAVISGDSDGIASFVSDALKEMKPEQAAEQIVKAMEELGELFDRKKVFLPQVIAAGNAMKNAFAVLKPLFSGKSKKVKVLLATVENDIHDIGKNILASVLESNNFDVIDLGISVPLARIVEEAKNQKPNVICLSALLTTTASEMPKIIKALRQSGINIPVFAGGAVVTSDFAKSIGAYYSGDAMDAVKKIREVLGI